VHADSDIFRLLSICNGTNCSLGNRSFLILARNNKYSAKCVNGILNTNTRHYYAFIWGTTWKKTHEKVTHLIFLYSRRCYQLTTHVNTSSEQLLHWRWLEYASTFIPAILFALQILGLATFILWPSRNSRKNLHDSCTRNVWWVYGFKWRPYGSLHRVSCVCNDVPSKRLSKHRALQAVKSQKTISRVNAGHANLKNHIVGIIEGSYLWGHSLSQTAYRHKVTFSELTSGTRSQVLTNIRGRQYTERFLIEQNKHSDKLVLVSHRQWRRNIQITTARPQAVDFLVPLSASQLRE
jgi:hypothetical protein